MGRPRIASIDEGHHSIVTLVSRHLHEFVCGLGGHDLILKIEPRRMALQCVSCTYETPGWTFEDKRARRTESRMTEWRVSHAPLQHNTSSSTAS